VIGEATIIQQAEVRQLLVSLSSIVVAAAFLITLFGAWFDRWITEFAVTDRRVIYKRGCITRHTAEMNMDKVESVSLNQSILVRRLEYGTLHVLGTGQGIEHLHRIAQPLALRAAIIAR
jgi:uncharacterized membrane protein YdbT with pleckstrin-like domain